MAVGGSDWADAGAWVQPARSSAAARPRRDAAAWDRAGTRSQARFGDALGAARGRDETATRPTAARASAARAASGDAHTEIARKAGAARRVADDRADAARHADPAPAGRRGRAGPAAEDPVRPERADDTAKADDTEAAEPRADPKEAATGQAAATPTQQPGLLALFAALAGGTAAAAPDGAAADAAGASGDAQIQGTPGASSPTGGGPAAVEGAAGPHAGAGPATDGTAAAEAVHAEPRADSLDGAAKPDFLTALGDANRDAAQGATGPNPAAASPAGATHAASSTAPAAQAAASQPAPAVQIGQVPMTIGLRSLQGSSEFQIRLDPAELGRIEVKLEIDKARGTVMAHLVVDRPDTLAMLQRDAGQLQQALSQAGLDASGGVGMSLRGDGGTRDGSPSEGGNRSRGGGAWTAETAESPQEAAPMRAVRGYGGLDIRI
ncbi:flagellar hook-length control protein FliK [uncultured Methylobacterium sp.]|uniref:flagellar hook-length control protein FliK n=1 Tax=uncultured Methylobacterium sp. TaxID=157278 RepID=UPI0035CB90CE